MCYAGGHGTLLQELVLSCSFERCLQVQVVFEQPHPLGAQPAPAAGVRTSPTFLLPGADEQTLLLFIFPCVISCLLVQR